MAASSPTKTFVGSQGWNKPNVAVLQTVNARVTSSLVVGYLAYFIVGSVLASVFAHYWCVQPLVLPKQPSIPPPRLRAAVFTALRYVLGMPLLHTPTPSHCPPPVACGYAVAGVLGLSSLRLLQRLPSLGRPPAWCVAY